MHDLIQHTEEISANNHQINQTIYQPYLDLPFELRSITELVVGREAAFCKLRRYLQLSMHIPQKTLTATTASTAENDYNAILARNEAVFLEAMIKARAEEASIPDAPRGKYPQRGGRSANYTTRQHYTASDERALDHIPRAPTTWQYIPEASETDGRPNTPESIGSYDSMPELQSVSSSSGTDSFTSHSQVVGRTEMRNQAEALGRIVKELSQKLRLWLNTHPELAGEVGDIQKDMNELEAHCTPDQADHMESVQQRLGQLDLCDPRCAICRYVRDDPDMAEASQEEID
ncbi:hypothetical protein B0H16DRAFT_1472012 [Mycena metata]|uniref:Uncharacterized protein n=1 Tax=Mycena metata TaxID=1033252 RepID=A0AAD7HPA0_9AGAR|nr:hypothetical protein B0H16DRAFT_1472012 [Mycena metata]